MGTVCGVCVCCVYHAHVCGCSVVVVMYVQALEGACPAVRYHWRGHAQLLGIIGGGMLSC